MGWYSLGPDGSPGGESDPEAAERGKRMAEEGDPRAKPRLPRGEDQDSADE
ncbi:hypothetical protein [Nocardiopsis lucentensis]|uniref:hypothetical protein n=1 Tax=Nocardiopsis lucentensis TaxID=53441 RepID=UPI0003489490|nr:hypothetical protein [Nocardiopsis lucentensis]